MASTLVAFFCVTTAVGLVNGKIERFYANKLVVKPGENIVLTCDFVDQDSHDPVHFYKHHPGNKTTPLTDNYALTEGLQVENTRFNFSYSDSGSGFVTQTLTILNAVLGDSGNYSCFTRDLDKKAVIYQTFLTIAVEDEPDTIMLFLDNIEVYNGSNSVTLKFLKSRTLRCEAKRSNPGANITITVGDGKHVHLTNVTVTNATYLFEERDPTFEFVVPVYRNTTALVSNWVFGPDAYGKPLVCSARVDKDAQGIMTSFIPVMAEGPPEFVCNDTVYARDGQRNFIINCSVYAKPALTKARFNFVKDKTNYEIDGFPLNEPHSSKDGKFRGIVQTYDNVKAYMLLTVDTVDLKAKMTFNFFVLNSEGQDIHQVIIQDPSAMISSSVALSTYVINFLFIWLFGFGVWAQL